MVEDKEQVASDLSPETRVRRRFWQNPEIEESLLSYDVQSCIAHVRMLGETGIVNKESCAVVLEGLEKIQKELAEGKSYLSPEDIDIHEGLERRLRELVGDIGGVIHIAKSRNDQIATDIRMWLRDSTHEIFESLSTLRQQLVGLAERDLDIVMPGYTHMQPAQPILLSHWWLANEARFRRDYLRLHDFYPRLNALPLGACVLAGTKEPIDRTLVAKYLNFDDVIENSLDAVSDRDFVIEFAAFAALVGVHLSQIGAELLLWATKEFGFIKLQKPFLFRTQNLPYKKNPELLEVLRSRPSMLYGRLMEFISQLKAVPSGYSQDLQECLPGLLDTVENLKFLLELCAALLRGIDIDQKRMREIACADLLNGSNATEYLINKGIDEEKAERVLENLTTYCQTRNKFLSDLALSEWQQFSPAFEADVYDYVTMEQSVGSFCSFGGSSRDQVESALNRAKDILAADIKSMHTRASGSKVQSETSKSAKAVY